MAYLLLFIASLASAGATLLLRRAGLVPAGLLLAGFEQSLWLKGLAAGVYGIGFLAYGQALKLVPAGLAYPLMTGAALLLTLGLSQLLLGEGISMRAALGAVLLLGGIVLIGAR